MDTVTATVVENPTFMDYLIKMLGVLIIIGIVYACMAIYYRLVKKKNGNIALSKLIPALAVIFGGFLAVVFFVKYPEIMPVSDVFTAMIIGGISGFAAVGANQFASKTFGKADPEAGKQEANKTIKVIDAEKPTETKSYVIVDDDLKDL